jgi:hypothetical protein
MISDSLPKSYDRASPFPNESALYLKDAQDTSVSIDSLTAGTLDCS